MLFLCGILKRLGRVERALSPEFSRGKRSLYESLNAGDRRCDLSAVGCIENDYDAIHRRSW